MLSIQDPQDRQLISMNHCSLHNGKSINLPFLSKKRLELALTQIFIKKKNCRQVFARFQTSGNLLQSGLIFSNQKISLG